MTWLNTILCLISSTAFQAQTDYAQPWQLGFQDPATPMMEGILALHNDIMFMMVVVCFFVLYLLIRVVVLFRIEKNNYVKIVHGKVIEIVWTIAPSLILALIAIPSFSLLYSLDEVLEPALTLKIIGHQWYWSYEYSDCPTGEQEEVSFDSYMIPEQDLELGQLRLLEVDNPIYLPVRTHIRLLITSDDVLHCWTIPSFGCKVDACPGRLNQASVFIQREGTFYGQCSEICWRLYSLWLSSQIWEFVRWLIGLSNREYDIASGKLGVKALLGNFGGAPSNSSEHICSLEQTRYRWSCALPEPTLKLTGIFSKTVSLQRAYPSHGDSWVRGSERSNTARSSQPSLKRPRSTEDRSNDIKLESPSKTGKLVREVKNLFLGHHFVGGVQQVFSSTQGCSRGFALVCRVHDGYQVRSYRSEPNYPAYRLRELETQITEHLVRNKWTPNALKREISITVEECHQALSNPEISSSDRNAMWDVFLNSLVFQVYAIETLSVHFKRGSSTAGVQSQMWTKDATSKIHLLASFNRLDENNTRVHDHVVVSLAKNNNQTRTKVKCQPPLSVRATQTLFAILLDPAAESCWDNLGSCSRSFGKVTSAHKAIGVLHQTLQRKVSNHSMTQDQIKLWSAVVRKGFNSKYQTWLINHVPIPPKYFNILEKWIKDGYVYIFGSQKRNATDSRLEQELGVGLHQGDLLSPILVKIALNGMEPLINEAVLAFQNQKQSKGRSGRVLIKRRPEAFALCLTRGFVGGSKSKTCRFIRYADEFVFWCQSPILYNLVQSKVQDFLLERGLEIHVTQSREIDLDLGTTSSSNSWFNMLGFTFRVQTRYLSLKQSHSSTPDSCLQGTDRAALATFVYPSNSSVLSFKNQIKVLLKENLNLSAYQIIHLLNPMIRCWVNYYCHFYVDDYGFGGNQSHRALNTIRKFLFNRLIIWGMKKHSCRSQTWVSRQYFLPECMSKQHGLSKQVMAEILSSAPQHHISTKRWKFYGLAYGDGDPVGTQKGVSNPRVSWLYWPNTMAQSQLRKGSGSSFRSSRGNFKNSRCCSP